MRRLKSFANAGAKVHTNRAGPADSREERALTSSRIYMDGPRGMVTSVMVCTLLGDPSRAKTELGWITEVAAQDMCKEMLANDLAHAKLHVLLKKYGYEVNVTLNSPTLFAPWKLLSPFDWG